MHAHGEDGIKLADRASEGGIGVVRVQVYGRIGDWTAFGLPMAQEGGADS